MSQSGHSRRVARITRSQMLLGDLARLMVKYAEAGGVRFSFHDLRSVRADGAATPEEARDRLRHAGVKTTSGTTCEGSQERNRGAEYSTLTRYSTLGNFWRVQVIDYWRARRDCSRLRRSSYATLRTAAAARQRPTWPKDGQVV